MKNTKLKDIQFIIKDKDIIKNLDHSLFNETPLLSNLLFFVGFFEAIFIFFIFFVNPSVPIGEDYFILKLILLFIIFFSSIIFSLISEIFFNYKDYCGLTVKIIKKIFYRFNKNEKETLRKLIEIDGYFISYTPNKMKKLLNYYNSLNDKQKKYFITKKDYHSILKENIINYIKSNDLETIKKEKEEITSIVFDNFQDYDIKYISNLIINKLKEDKEAKRKAFLENFNDYEEKNKEENKKIIKQI